MNASSVTRPPLTFLLGLQRSGSTWLTNIFDAHEQAWVFMEPFAPDYGIFPEFPETNFFLEESSPALRALLREQMPERLLHFKQLFGSRALRSARWFRAERSLVRLMLARSRLLPELVQSRVRKTELLNLNRMDPHAPVVDKDAPPRTWIIKELRLAGKIRLLRDAFPDARFVVLLRHPCANVHAIAAWFARGRLKELRRDLNSFVATLSAQRLGERYQKQLEACRLGDETHRLALYWRVHNEALVEELAQHAAALVLTYEELASSPQSTAARILEFCGLPPSDSVLRYVTASSTTSAADTGRITTLRDSATHYRAWQEKVAPALRKATETLTHDSALLNLFAPYYDAGA
jgi:hypothetical protein